ncbi:glutaredoxin [Petrotoga sp. 9PW.55.5.1]|jgi:glutaredoxin-like YruB-family protein|uniref:glutaredoxin family protein n=1 Tax=Petrotoga sp. 9PW.55.5.1 TaxID=1308979 RepID=UPI000DC5951B|nr:glutaredoxin family protein [Petrotoga sp. 9PW.55.5.1]RAO98783.1 glutaredoxin [Petrotoga sp. 9PW.55.5.1]
MQHLKVKIYTTPSCPWCRKAKSYFKELGIQFKEIDVSKDQKAAEELVRRTHQMGVPVIQIGSHYIVGFDKNRIDKLIGVN